MVLELISSDETIKEVSNPIKAEISHGSIEFRNVSFSYDRSKLIGERKMVIDQISFKVPGGSSIGIVGQTGSGKSTITRLLYRFYD